MVKFGLTSRIETTVEALTWTFLGKRRNPDKEVEVRGSSYSNRDYKGGRDFQCLRDRLFYIVFRGGFIRVLNSSLTSDLPDTPDDFFSMFTWTTLVRKDRSFGSSGRSSNIPWLRSRNQVLSTTIMVSES